MIARMTKYDFVLFAAQSEDFIERLRELGLVDITTTGWEPSEGDRQLLLDIEGYTKAIEFLGNWSKDKSIEAEPYASGAEAYERYTATQREASAARSEIARLEKAADELRPWGEFDVERAKNLASQGVVLRYFSANSSVYDNSIEEWSQSYTISVIERNSSTVWFVIITTPNAELSLDAQEMKAPTMDIREAEHLIKVEQEHLSNLDGEFARAAASLPLIQSEAARLNEKLQEVRVVATAEKAADGTLCIMEGWAETTTVEKVDALLEEYPNVIYLKSDPTPEDDTPVKLKNNRYARLFEMIGSMYALPKYGTLDLTPFFAPFYMLFFAICLNDAGYGSILFTLGLILSIKSKAMRRAGYLTMVCGGATTLFGLYTGSLFGMSIPSLMGYTDLAECPIPFLDFQSKFFSWALALGVVQILFGMLLNIVFKARVFGITSTFPLLGWFIILVSGCLAAGLQLLDPSWVIPGFTTSSIAFYVAMGIGAVLMLLLNDVHRNPLTNFASGLWDTYNNITGLLSDVLSYIRLFAIGLSGGVLAQVFNALAMGLTGLDAGIEQFTVGTIFQIIGATAILLVGHGINLFMSSISSFVHPMRLTFVEFYKNAGFEMTTRTFEPLKKEQ